MGDFADDEFDRFCQSCGEAREQFESDLNYLKREQKRRKENPSEKPEDWSWITRDGNIIKIGDMTDSHLFNTIKFIERKIDEFLF